MVVIPANGHERRRVLVDRVSTFQTSVARVLILELSLGALNRVKSRSERR